MPRPPDLLNLVAWLFALWLAAAAVLLVLAFTYPPAALHWTTVVYLTATVTFSLFAFGGMGLDKSRARRGKWRVPEFQLHLFELLGGWPGSLLGQRTFHHKTRKLTYQGVFWGIVTVHLALLAWTTYLWWNPPHGTAEEPPPVVIEPAADGTTEKPWSMVIEPAAK